MNVGALDAEFELTERELHVKAPAAYRAIEVITLNLFGAGAWVYLMWKGA